MSKIRVNLTSGNVFEKPLVTCFQGTSANYVVFDNEMNGSMGLPIICISKLNGNRLEKIFDQSEWASVKENLKSIRGYSSMSQAEKTRLQMPFIHTTLLVNELINLEYESKGTNIKVFEKSGMRKDRVSSVGYNYWVQKQLSLKLKKPQQSTTNISSLTSLARKPKLYSH